MYEKNNIDYVNLEEDYNESTDVKEKEIIYQKNTKHQFTRFASEDYNFPLMLSEFIDNSISAYEKNFASYDNEDIDEGFETRDYSQLQVKFVIKNFGTDENNNSEIIVVDNGPGMTYEELKQASKMYDVDDKGINDLNQHGIGMKSACFWLGKDVSVHTRRKNSLNINFFNLETSTKDEREECNIEVKRREVKPAQERFCGTQIKIKNINKAVDKFDYFSNSNFLLSYLQIFLGIKFLRYIKKGLRIIFEYTTDDVKSLKRFEILGFDRRYLNKDELLNALLAKKSILTREEKISLFKSELVDKINEIANNKDGKTSKNAQIIASRFCNGSDTKIHESIEVEGKSFTMEIGITNASKKISNIGHAFYGSDGNIVKDETLLKNKYSIELDAINKWTSFNQLQGIYFFHHNRGLLMGPLGGNKQIKGKHPEPVTVARDGQKIDTITTPIRLIGWADIYGVKTEVNKANFHFSNLTTNNLKASLETMWRQDFKRVLQLIVNFEDLIKKRENVDKDYTVRSLDKNIEPIIGKTEKTFENSVIYNYDDEESNTAKTSWNLNYRDQKYKFVIYCDDIEEPFNKLEVDDITNQSICYEIVINKSHPFWYPYNESTGEKAIIKFRNFVYPFVVAMTIAQHKISDMALEIKKSDGYIDDTIINIDFIDIFGNITKNWQESESEDLDE